MFQNITQAYTLADATSEIAIMLIGAFVLGMMLAWLLKPSRGFYEANTISHAPSGSVVGPVVVIKEDELQLIEGIGPAIEKLLKKNNVSTYADVIRADVSGLENILEAGGSRFKMHIPTTWPDQAKLADKGKWAELEEYQEILNGGK